MNGVAVVRAKFKVDSIEKFEAHSTMRLSPVVGGSKENEQFWKRTPNGKIEFACLNHEATAKFEVGKSYYIDFIPSE